MVDQISINPGTSKEDQYKQLFVQIKALVGGDKNRIGVLANVSAALHHSMAFLWTGFYLVDGNQLVLGPFQGPVACMSIDFNKGVCGSAWATKSTLVVPDVDAFPGHIACSSLSKSEIVVPIFSAAKDVVAVLDIDSDALNTFDEIDQKHLEILCSWISEQVF